MNTRFSLRALLAIVALVAVGCSAWIAKVAYDRKQEELLTKAKESIRQGNALGRVVVQSLDGEPIAIRGDAVTLPIMESIIAAKRIEHVVVDGPLRPEVKSLLEDEFEAIHQQDGMTVWDRN